MQRYLPPSPHRQPHYSSYSCTPVPHAGTRGVSWPVCHREMGKNNDLYIRIERLTASSTHFCSSTCIVGKLSQIFFIKRSQPSKGFVFCLYFLVCSPSPLSRCGGQASPSRGLQLTLPLAIAQSVPPFLRGDFLNRRIPKVLSLVCPLPWQALGVEKK